MSSRTDMVTIVESRQIETILDLFLVQDDDFKVVIIYIGQGCGVKRGRW